MWRILHRLFGWHYINVGGGCYKNAVRLRYTPGERRPYVALSHLEFYRPEPDKFGPYDWVPLTFRREDFWLSLENRPH